MLAVGITGLNLAGVAFWVPPVFNGTALIVAGLGCGDRRQAKHPAGSLTRTS